MPRWSRTRPAKLEIDDHVCNLFRARKAFEERLGMMPRHAAELAKIAELYWQLFVVSDNQFRQEVQFRTTPDGT